MTDERAYNLLCTSTEGGRPHEAGATARARRPDRHAGGSLVRDSTAGQWVNFGPDAQREQQDRAIERYDLVDAGLKWSVAASGWTSAWRTATWEAMIGSATSGALDVLVVGPEPQRDQI